MKYTIKVFDINGVWFDTFFSEPCFMQMTSDLEQDPATTVEVYTYGSKELVYKTPAKKPGTKYLLKFFDIFHNPLKDHLRDTWKNEVTQAEYYAMHVEVYENESKTLVYNTPKV